MRSEPTSSFEETGFPLELREDNKCLKQKQFLVS